MNRTRPLIALAVAGEAALSMAVPDLATAAGESAIVAAPEITWVESLLIVGLVVLAGWHLLRRFRAKNPCGGCGCTAAKGCLPGKRDR